MTDTFTLELNDCGLTVSKNGEQVFLSPGYALIDGSLIEVGESAYQQARLHPRRAHNHFWHRLSLDPLVYPSQRFRHQADLAYAHLMHIAESVEGIGEVIVAVPSHYTREQLSLLLGIASESPLNVVGLVDASVAALASRPVSESSCYLDLQLHQSVLVSLGAGDKLKRVQYETLDRAGLSSLYDKWVQLIANAFIDQCRFDPLHSAETEQALYNHLPQWLEAIDQRDEVVLELASNGKRFDCRLKSDAALDAIAPTYQRITQAVDALLQNYGGELFVSSRFAALPGINANLPAFTELAENSVAASCTNLADEIRSRGESLNFVTALPVVRQSTPEVPRVASQAAQNSAASSEDLLANATHLLDGFSIYPLALELFLGTRGGNANITVAHTAAGLDAVKAKLIDMDGNWQVIPITGVSINVNQQPVNSERLLKVGDRISLPGSDASLTLVREIADGQKETL